MDAQLRKEAISVMKDGANELIDRARAKWISGAYGVSGTATAENLERWGRIRSAVSELVSEMSRKGRS